MYNHARVHYFSALKRTCKMCSKSIGRPMSQQSGALCSAIDAQCQRVRMSVRAALAACVRSEHVPAVVRKRLSTSLCYRSALCDGLAARWRVMCASSSLAARRACDVLRSVCTKCVSVCPLCASVSIVRCTGLPVRIVRITPLGHDTIFNFTHVTPCLC